MKKLLIVLVLSSGQVFAASTIGPTIGGGQGGGSSSGGSATNIFLGGAGASSIVTNASGNFTVNTPFATIGATPVSNALYAIYANNATNAGYATNFALPKSLLSARPPGIGKTLSGTYASSGNNSSFSLLAPPGASGIIDDIWCVPYVEGGHALYTLSNHIRFQVFVDMGSNTNGSSVVPYLALDIPLSHIFNNQFRQLDGVNWWATQRGTLGWDVCDMSTNLLSNSALQTFNLKWKIPFTNGCFARLTNDLGGTNWTGGYISSMASTSSLSPEYAMLRLKTKSVFQQGITASSSNYLFTISTPGYAIELIGGLRHSQSSIFFAFCDSHGLAFWLDGTTRWAASGLDDLFKRTYGFSQGQFIGDDSGCMNYVWNAGHGSLLVDPSDGYATFEGYRQFLPDTFRWNTSFVAYTDGEQAMDNLYFTMLYYEIH